MGMCVSGIPALIDGMAGTEYTMSTVFFSMICCIISHGLKAFETILEEKILHDVQMTAMELAGSEGLWGLFITSLIILPLLNITDPHTNYLIYENSLETFSLFGKNPNLFWVQFIYLFDVTCYTLSGFYITEFSTAIHRNLYETVRPLFVWGLSTVLHYIITRQTIGEELTTKSFYEVAGFFVSVFGSLVYTRTVKFHCFSYSDDLSDYHRLNTLRTTLYT